MVLAFLAVCAIAMSVDTAQETMLVLSSPFSTMRGTFASLVGLATIGALAIDHNLGNLLDESVVGVSQRRQVSSLF